MPDWKNEITLRIERLNLSPVRETEIIEELSQHLDDRYRDALINGADQEEAYQAALLELDECDLLGSELRRVEKSVPQGGVPLGGSRAGGIFSTVAQDFRYGVRALKKNAGFSIVSILTLAVGIGATTAIFSVVYSTLFEPLPYAKPDQLVVVWSRPDGGKNIVSGGDYFEWKQRSTSFQDLSAWGNGAPMNFSSDERPEQIQTGAVTPGFYNMLGTAMYLGRDLLPDEGQYGNDHYVLVTHLFWTVHLGGDRNIIGHDIRLNGEPYTVVGVLPPGLADRSAAQIIRSLAFGPDDINHENHSILVMGRLRDGVTIDQAQSELSGVARQLAVEYPKTNARWDVSVESLHLDFLPETTRRNLWLLQGAVGFLFLIACVNVANLLFARGTARRREIALRAALGATRKRIFRQLLTENVVMAGSGGIAGVLVAYGLIKGIVMLMPPDLLPIEADIRISLPVLFLTVVTTLVAGILFGCLPAWQATQLDLNEALKQGGRSEVGSGKRGIRRALVIAEFALALTMLTGGGLALKSFWNLTRVDLGIRTDHVLTFTIPIPRSQLKDRERVDSLYRRLLDRIRSAPGVSNAAITTGIPVRGPGIGMGFTIAGDPPVEQVNRPGAGFQMVTPGYYDTLGIKVLKGRAIEDYDTAQNTRVAMVNERLVERFFSGVDPIGKQIEIDQLDTDGKPGGTVALQIIGVFHTVRNGGLRDDYPEIDVPFWQSPLSNASFVVRTAGEPDAMTRSIAAAVNSVEPDLPIAGVRTMDQIASESIAIDRFGMVLFGSFAIAALLLATIGVYGVMAFGVAQRTHEFGLRMALGAGRSDVLMLVLLEGVTLAVLGSIAGFGGAYLVGRAMASTLYGVKPLDLGAFSAVAGILFFATLLACYMPARRAAKVDPMIALRNE